MTKKVLLYCMAGGLLLAMQHITVRAAESGRTVPHYTLGTEGDDWDGTYYYLPDGTKATEAFFCDGEYTYYLMNDGTPMTDRLTYHPDGEHIIYFDENGHEIFSDFTHVKTSIEGTPVDDLCFFDVYGYMYVDVLTYGYGDKSENLYYANPYGVMERNGWFRFSDGGIGCANEDGTLLANQYASDWNGKLVYMEANGYVRGSWAYGVGAAYHTEEEVRDYMGKSGADFYNATEMQVNPSFSVPYDPGSLTEESLNAALSMLNQVRYIAGLSDTVVLKDEYTERAQAAAFVNAVNGTMSHYPDRPEGMSDELYQKGYTGASRSNIAYGWGGRYTLSSFIRLWMDDSDKSNIDRLGHRRWILNPSFEETGFGYAVNDGREVHSSIYVIEDMWYDKSSVTGVAWPAREMPLEYFGDDMAWSYSYGAQLSDVTVKLTCLNEGSYQEWNFSAASSDGYFNVNNDNYGLNGCVIFQPEGISINAGDQYRVDISEDGETIAIYTVTFF